MSSAAKHNGGRSNGKRITIELKARGLIAQATNEEKIRELLDNEKITFYIGFDPTADSLHVGHFVQLMVMALHAEGRACAHRPVRRRHRA